MKRGEQVVSIVLLLFSLFILRESTLIEAGAEFGMGPAFLPMWLSAGLALISLVMLARTSTVPASQFAPSVWPDRAGVLRVTGVALFFLLALFVMKPLGIPISIALIVGATMSILGARNPGTIAFAAIVAGLAVWLVFGRWLAVSLPMGILEELLPLY